MITHDCTANTANLENTRYLYPVFSHSVVFRIAEDSDDYDAAPMTDETLPAALRQAEIRALHTAASGQVGRLKQLASLLVKPEPLGRSAEDLQHIAVDIRNAASTLDSTLHGITGPMIDEFELE